MSTSNTRNVTGPTATSDSVTSPSRKTEKTTASVRPTTSAGTGFPPNIEGPGLVFTQTDERDAPRGNQKFDFMMREAGYYGHFLPMDKCAANYTPVTLDCSAIRDGIHNVLSTALETLCYKRGDIIQSEIRTLAKETATTLMIGTMLAFYSRLRVVNKGNWDTHKLFIRRPYEIDHFEVPTPYALAIQHLGIFKVENMTHELELIPVVSEAEAKKFCIGANTWSPPAYQTAVDFAKRLGISFMKTDLTVKLGTAWWLLKSKDDGEDYQLEACIPESNYTPEDAVIRALWCVNSAGTFHVDIADLSELTMERGSFLRSPPNDIALTCFYGMMESSEDLYDIK